MNKKEVFVSMSNLLIRASHGLSLAERRILMLAISQIEPKKVYAGNPVFRVYAADIINLSGVSPQTAYDDGRKGQKKLYDRSITLLHDMDTGELKPGSTRWITKAHYQKNEGWLEVAINNELLPYITELKREFTTYDHSRSGGFRSIYSHRVFDLLMQFKTKGLLRINIDDFSNAVEAPPSVRANFANIKRRIIEPALKEIGDKDGLPVTWEPIKAGRKVKGIEFKFPAEQQKPLPLPPVLAELRKRSATTTKPNPDKTAAEARRAVIAEFTGIADLAKRGGVPIEGFINQEKMKEFKKHGLI